ncbi:hypothetical protein O181_110947 [Austropuccinia psidii MF-1]|uniref:Uncharacterized protein n=1 Tax=Austropuccinia psidii MF-1 TaxID=1389203 RepID=A0A9Q3K0U8_9BASI|nr:hypothetical protein [Austropuccinia psidii MF-1]
MFAWGSPTAGHFLHVLTRPAQVVAPGVQPNISLGGWPLSWSFVHACGKDPDANLGGLVPASNAIGVSVYVDHGSWPAPPLIMPHITPWKPSRHRSAKNFRQNQADVWWHATKHISTAHTKTSPQSDCPLKPPTFPSRSLCNN